MANNERWLGIFKVLEECGELSTVLGKLGPFPDCDHPDGAGDLKQRIEMEIADVLAACEYFVMVNSLDAERVSSRRAAKVQKFLNWTLTGLPASQPAQEQTDGE